MNGGANPFAVSATSTEGRTSTQEVRAWLDCHRKKNVFRVTKIPLDHLQDWDFELATGDLAHKSGKFFRIEGVEVQTNRRPVAKWQQPIILQPEIGILGFVTRKFDGVLHFLAQAKMEPGNVNLVQLSPTVQATPSNYTQVHKGKRPPFLEYFLAGGHANVLLDQLQSEQGTRFLWKHNRNVVVQVEDPLEAGDEFCWVTLGQILQLAVEDDQVNMDARTVIGCIPFSGDGACSSAGPQRGSFAAALWESAVANDHRSEWSLEQAQEWLMQRKAETTLLVRRMSLNEIRGWSLRDGTYGHEQGRFFSVIGVRVYAETREVSSWDQPLIESAKGGVLAFVCQRHKGVLHFLMQVRAETGTADRLELGPTVQFTPANYEGLPADAWPPFHKLVQDAPTERIRFSAVQSEEGGRFYCDRRRNTVVELPEDERLDLPWGYIWLTLRQMKDLCAAGEYLNIEARTLLACLPIGVAA